MVTDGPNDPYPERNEIEEQYAREAEERFRRLREQLDQERQEAREAMPYWERLDAALASRGGGGQRAPRGANQDAILKVVSERAGVSPSEIAQATSIAQPVVYSTLKKLVDKGQVVKEELPGGTTGYKVAA